MIYTVWAGTSITLVPGVNPPAFADGTPQDPANRKVHQFAAMNWAEAVAVFEQFMDRHSGLV